MFPIGDDNSDRTIQPIVNYAIIGLNVLVFVLLQQLGTNESFDYAFSLVPKEITTGVDLVGPQIVVDPSGGEAARIMLYSTPFSVYFNFLASMFMHGGFVHLFGNMMFLLVFGDNLENLIGHVKYAVFYLVCGFAAALAQIFMDPNSVIPMLGASGAISGVLGGYVVLFPTRKVRAIIFNFLTTIPAVGAIGIWIVYQAILGWFAPAGTGGVAYAAHIGGFVAGAALIKLFALGRRF
jgi:membrane associated rhomboid family serine protease